MGMGGIGQNEMSMEEMEKRWNYWRREGTWDTAHELGEVCQNALKMGTEVDTLAQTKCFTFLKVMLPLSLDRLIPRVVRETLDVADSIYKEFVEASNNLLVAMFRLNSVVRAILAIAPLVLAFMPALVKAAERTTLTVPQNPLTTLMPPLQLFIHLIIMSMVTVILSQTAQNIFIWLSVTNWTIWQLLKIGSFTEIAGPHTSYETYKEIKKTSKVIGFIPKPIAMFCEWFITLLLFVIGLAQIFGSPDNPNPVGSMADKKGSLFFSILVAIFNFMKAKTLTVIAGSDVFISILMQISQYDIMRPRESIYYRDAMKHAVVKLGGDAKKEFCNQLIKIDLNNNNNFNIAQEILGQRHSKYSQRSLDADIKAVTNKLRKSTASKGGSVVSNPP